MTNEEQERQFHRWLENHRGLLVKVARSFADSSEDQDDLLQEIMLQLWRSIPSFRADSAESTWIYKVALNRALVWKRKETRRRRATRVLLNEPLAGTADERATRARLDALYSAVRRLSKSEKALILLAMDGVGYREMAAVLAISESNVGARLTRVKKKLATIIERDRL